MHRSSLLRSSTHLGVAALTLLGSGCLHDLLEARGVSDGRPAPAPRTEISDLWDLAPVDAVSGTVLQDGALARGLAFIADPGDSTARRALHDVLRDRTKLPFDPLTADAWVNAGIDPSRGGALFGFADDKRDVVAVLPVTDRVRFRHAFGFDTHTIEGRELDVLPNGLLCDDVVGRYICAKDPSAVAPLLVPHPSPLADAARASSDHGELEVVVMRDDPGLHQANKRGGGLGIVTRVTGALRFRDDGAALHVVAHGDFATPEARGYYAGIPPREMVDAAAGAASFGRLHLEPGAVWMKRKIDDDLRSELIEQLTGDISVLEPGRGFASASITAPIADPSRVERYLKKRCGAEAAKPDTKLIGGFKVEAHGCRAVIDTRRLPLPVRFPTVPLRVEAIGSKLVVTFGASDREPALFAFGAPETEAAKAAVEGPSTVVFVGHDLTLGPEVSAGKMVRDAIPLLGGRVAEALDAWNYAAAHVFEGVARARVTDETAEITIDLTTFGTDPREAQEAYAGALRARFADDEAGYRASLATISERFPKTRAGRRAAEITSGPAFLGAGVALLATLGLVGDGGDKKR